MKSEKRIFLTKEDIKNSLTSLDINKGDSIFVHCSLRSLGYVCGGPQIIIEALIETVGPEGTIVMPTQSWKNLDPQAGVHWEEPKEWWSMIRENWPAYNKDITPTNTMGAVAEMFRQWSGTKRSNHPARSIAAWGKHADYLTENHDLSNIFGKNSPLDRFYKIKGDVLLMGVGYDKNTSLHLADELADYQSKHYVDEFSAIEKDGKREWVKYNTLFVDGEDFNEIGKDFEAENKVKSVILGNGIVRKIKQVQLVDYAVNWIEKNRK